VLVLWLLIQLFSIETARGFAPSPTAYVAHRHRGSSSLWMLGNESTKNKGKLLILGGTGFLGQTVCKRAVLEGYEVTSLSRRGLPPTTTTDSSTLNIDYRQGDARQKQAIDNILLESDDYKGIIHCIGLLFDDASGLGEYNRFVSGSGSLPDPQSTYDAITRQTAFNAIDAAREYAIRLGTQQFPFVFTSAAEAGWPDVPGGTFVEQNLAPDFLKRYLTAKRAVEHKLLSTSSSSEPLSLLLRPIIMRPSLIYSMDKPASFPSVGALFVGNKIGLPFVDRPVTVQSLAVAMIRSLSRDFIQGILRYPEIDQLSK
jgi:nucleoside-diphosphate-sugar epimerase